MDIDKNTRFLRGELLRPVAAVATVRVGFIGLSISVLFEGISVVLSISLRFGS